MANAHPAGGSERGGERAGAALAGAVDLGTNTALLVIARLGAEGGLDIVEERVLTPRLGEGLARTGSIAPAAIARGLSALAELRGRLDAREVAQERRRFVGTAVLRRAANAADFVARARAELGVDLCVLSEDEEARLAHEAIATGQRAETLVVVDVGGGSSEVAWEGGRRRASIPLGAVVLEESHPGDPIRRRKAARAAVAALPADIAGQARGSAPELVLVGGTSTNLASLLLARERFLVDGLEGVSVPIGAARDWAERLAELDEDGRLALPIEPERAGILPAGLDLLAEILQRIGAGEARVSVRGIRHALVERLLRGTEGPRAQS